MEFDEDHCNFKSVEIIGQHIHTHTHTFLKILLSYEGGCASKCGGITNLRLELPFNATTIFSHLGNTPNQTYFKCWNPIPIWDTHHLVNDLDSFQYMRTHLKLRNLKSHIYLSYRCLMAKHILFESIIHPIIHKSISTLPRKGRLWKSPLKGSKLATKFLTAALPRR